MTTWEFISTIPLPQLLFHCACHRYINFLVHLNWLKSLICKHLACPIFQFEALFCYWSCGPSLENLWAVVNNAGIASFTEIEWCSLGTYRKLLEVNALGPVMVTKTFLPLLRRGGGGRVVVVASLAGECYYRINRIYFILILTTIKPIII